MADQAQPTAEAAPQAAGTPAPVAGASPDASTKAQEGSTPSPPPKPEEREARRAALLKREAERVASQRAEFEAKQKGAETEVGELRKQATEYAEFKKLVKENPLQALVNAGLDYDSLISSELSRQELEANPAIKEVRELKARLAEEEKKRQESELGNVKAQHQRQIDIAVREIETLIDANAEKYEFLKKAGAAKDVFQRIYDHFVSTTKRDAQGRVVQPGRTLTAQEACDLIESEYEDSWKDIASLKKVAAFFQSKAAPAPDKDKNNDTKHKGSEREEKSPVLSNSNTSGPVQTTRLTKKEKTLRAFEAMRAAAAGH